MITTIQKSADNYITKFVIICALKDHTHSIYSTSQYVFNATFIAYILQKYSIYYKNSVNTDCSQPIMINFTGKTGKANATR